METLDYKTILNVTRIVSKCPQLSEDLAQDVSMAIIQQPSNKSIDRRLIITIARRRMANIYRKAYHTTRVQNEIQQTTNQQASHEQQIIARELLQKLLLSPKELQVILSGSRQQRYYLREQLKKRLQKITSDTSTI